jgi:transcriptional regulator with XRE-family HTH domain
MKKQNFGTMIATLRKEKGMTQLDLAEKMGVTDKAVSKWERDLSFPDVNSLPKLAEIFEVSVDELMQVKAEEKEQPQNDRVKELISLIFKGVALAMGVSVTVLSFLNQIEPNSAIGMLGIGLACISVSLF